MSATHTSDAAHGLGYARVALKSGWFIALGAILIIAGVMALGDVVAFAFVSVVFIGAMLLIGGVSQIIQAFMTKTWGAFVLNVIMGVVSIIAGFLQWHG